MSIYETEGGCSCYATYFRQMLDRFGGVEVAKKLLEKTQVQEGLMALWKMGHLRNSVEAHALKPKFRHEFGG